MPLQRRPITPDQALQRLEQQCAAAEMSSGEARQKLRRWGITPSDAEKIVNSLIGHRFIDDNRFAGAFARDRFLFGGWGRIKIAMQLRSKGIRQDTIREALDSIDSTLYQQRLFDAIRRDTERYADSITDFKVKQKIARRFIARGFEPSLVITTLRQILQ